MFALALLPGRNKSACLAPGKIHPVFRVVLGWLKGRREVAENSVNGFATLGWEGVGAIESAGGGWVVE